MGILSLNEINRRIQKDAPNVELVRGDGYHYYVYSTPGEYETESVMVKYTSHIPADRWIADGIDFDKRMVEKIEYRKEIGSGFRGGPFGAMNAGRHLMLED